LQSIINPKKKVNGPQTYNPINVCSLLKSNTNTFCRTQHIRTQHIRTTEDDIKTEQDAAGRVKIIIIIIKIIARNNG